MILEQNYSINLKKLIMDMNYCKKYVLILGNNSKKLIIKINSCKKHEEMILEINIRKNIRRYKFLQKIRINQK